MAKKMLIDATHPEETRVVVVDGQKVEDFDFETVTRRQLAGNIYLAKVTRVEPSLQAAFVEYGGNRHGFLAFSEVHPDYYQIPVADREALLAEEAREEEERRAREEAEAEAPKKSRKRGRSKAKAAATDATDSVEGGDDVPGLEVIEVEAGDSDDASPSGLEVAGEDGDAALMTLDPAGEDVIVAREPELDADETAVADATATEPGAAEPEAIEPEVTEPEADAPVVIAEAEAAPADEAPADEAPAAEAPEGEDPVTDAPPKTIAESAGLDGDERVTEEIGDESSARTVTASDSAEEIAETSDPVAEDPAPEAEAAAPTEETAQAPDAPDAEAEAPAPEAPDAQTAPEDATDTAPTEAGAEAAEATDAEATEDAEKPAKKSRRRKRSRGKAAEQDSTESEDQDDSANGGEVESVGAEDTLEEAARARTRLRRKYKIQDVIKVRQILLVQVVKEERGSKGAAVTTYHVPRRTVLRADAEHCARRWHLAQDHPGRRPQEACARSRASWKCRPAWA